MASLQQTDAAMRELVKIGKIAHGKLAYFAGVLSIQTSVENNAAMAVVMRKYAFTPLPIDREVLRQELKAATQGNGALSGGIMSSQLDTLYRIEQLWNAGIIHFNTGYTFESQCVWRKSTVSAIRGMGYKTVSFALHIYAPQICKILTIDRWHILYFTGKTNKGLTVKQYLDIEQRLLDACELVKFEAATNEQDYWLLTYAAFLWEATRLDHTLFPEKQYETDGSYGKLSCYI